MREESSLCDDMIDRNWVLKRKRKRITSGVNLLNGKEGTSLSSESLLKSTSVKRKLKGDIDKIKGHDGVRYFFLLNMYSGHQLFIPNSPLLFGYL